MIRPEWRSGARLLLLAAAVVLMPRVPPFSLFETWLSDVRLALLARAAPDHPRVVVVEISEETLARLGRRSPVDRDLLARLIEQIGSARPLAIGIDILIDQATEPARDEALAQALRLAQVPVVLTWADTVSAPGTIEPFQEAYMRQFFATIGNPQVQRGLSYLPQDNDGVVRRVLLHAPSGEVREGFAVVLAAIAGVAAPAAGDMVIDFYGHPAGDTQPFNRLAAHLLDRDHSAIWGLQERAMAGRIVLIGVNATGADRHRTPFATDLLSGQRDTAGVFVQAQALAQLLDGRRVSAVPWWLIGLMTAVSLALGFMLGFLELAVLQATAAALAGVLLVMAAAAAIFAWGGPFFGTTYGPAVPLASPAAGLFAALTLGIAHRRGQYATEKRFIRSVLTRYVAPEVVNHLLSHPEDLRLGGERREMTFVYTDIAGFTTFCERADPAVLVALLNDYLGGMSEIVHEHHGTIGGFRGDAILAFWGAPLESSGHAAGGLACAIAMDRFARAFRAGAAANGHDFGATRIGVHSGGATVGNFGGAARMEYMAHGDVVNTVARLEGANKFLNTSIVVSESTARLVRTASLRPVAELGLVGRSTRLAVFEPVQAGALLTLQEYMSAYDLLRRGAPEARAAFEALHARDPADGVVRLHLERLRHGASGVIIRLESK